MNQKRILVIEDDDGIRETIKLCLQTVARWQVLMAEDGFQGLALAQTEQPDAILLDMMMPKLDGISTLKQLQGNSDTQDIPTIFLTAKGNINEQELKDLGVKGIICKPFVPWGLVSQICAIFHWQL